MYMYLGIENAFPGDFWESQGILIDSYSIRVRIQCSWFKTLTWVFMSSSSATKSTLTVPPSALGYKWVPANLQCQTPHLNGTLKAVSFYNETFTYGYFQAKGQTEVFYCQSKYILIT